MSTSISRPLMLRGSTGESLILMEIWFSLLSRSALPGASFTSVRQLRQAIDRFLAAYNPNAAPFAWRKQQVHPVPLKHTFADLCK